MRRVRIEWEPEGAVAIVGEGYRVGIEMLYRLYPKEEDYYDGNWFEARFTVELPNSRVVPKSPVVWKNSLHLGDVACFRTELAKLIEAGEGRACLEMMENYFCMSVTVDGNGAHWKGRIKGDHTSAYSRPGMPSSPFLFHVAFDVEISSLLALLTQIDLAMERCQLRSPRPPLDGTDRSVETVTRLLAQDNLLW